MVGEAEEAIAPVARGERHLLDRALAVGGPDRVAVHLTDQVGQLDEVGEGARARRLELAAVLP